MAAAFFLVAAAPIQPGPVPAELTRVVDGDTLEVNVYPWLTARIGATVRVKGLDTPEKHSNCAEERVLAQDATARVQALLSQGVWLCDVEPKTDRYGRILARVVTLPVCGGPDLTSTLIEEGLGRSYDGGKRQSWCR